MRQLAILILAMLGICVLCTIFSVDSNILLSFGAGIAFCVGTIVLLGCFFKKEENIALLCYTALGMGIVLVLSTFCLDIYPSLTGTAFVGVMGLAMLLTLLLTLLLGVLRWRTQSRFWMLPFVISALLLSLARSSSFVPRMAAVVDDWQFKLHIEQYAAMVNSIKKSPAPSTSSLHPIDLRGRRDVPWGVTAVLAASWNDGAVGIEFIRSSKYVRVHRGYLFEGFDDTDMGAVQLFGATRFISKRHILGNWYEFEE